MWVHVTWCKRLGVNGDDHYGKFVSSGEGMDVEGKEDGKKKCNESLTF